MNVSELTSKDIQKLVLEFYIRVSEIDTLATLVLKSHFLIEEEIDAVLAPVAKSPKYLKLGSYPTFDQKVKCIRKFPPLADDQLWQPILKINTLRNKDAHRFDGPERKRALQDLRQVFHQSLTSYVPDFKDPVP
jgi:hypothetical protein